MSLISDVVAIVDGVAEDLQWKSKVTHRVWTGDAGKGDDAFTNVTRRAVVERKQRRVRTFTGEEAVSSTTVLFTAPASVTRVKEFDQILLQDGTGGPVMGVGGFMDGATDEQAYTEVYL